MPIQSNLLFTALRSEPIHGAINLPGLKVPFTQNKSTVSAIALGKKFVAPNPQQLRTLIRAALAERQGQRTASGKEKTYNAPLPKPPYPNQKRQSPAPKAGGNPILEELNKTDPRRFFTAPDLTTLEGQKQAKQQIAVRNKGVKVETRLEFDRRTRNDITSTGEVPVQDPASIEVNVFGKKRNMSWTSQSSPPETYKWHRTKSGDYIADVPEGNLVSAKNLNDLHARISAEKLRVAQETMSVEFMKMGDYFKRMKSDQRLSPDPRVVRAVEGKKAKDRVLFITKYGFDPDQEPDRYAHMRGEAANKRNANALRHLLGDGFFDFLAGPSLPARLLGHFKDPTSEKTGGIGRVYSNLAGELLTTPEHLALDLGVLFHPNSKPLSRLGAFANTALNLGIVEPITALKLIKGSYRLSFKETRAFLLALEKLDLSVNERAAYKDLLDKLVTVRKSGGLLDPSRQLVGSSASGAKAPTSDPTIVGKIWPESRAPTSAPPIAKRVRASLSMDDHPGTSLGQGSMPTEAGIEFLGRQVMDKAHLTGKSLWEFVKEIPEPVRSNVANYISGLQYRRSSTEARSLKHVMVAELEDLFGAQTSKVGFTIADKAVFGEVTLPSGAKFQMHGGPGFRLKGTDPSAGDGIAWASSSQSRAEAHHAHAGLGALLQFTISNTEKNVFASHVVSAVRAEIAHALGTRSASTSEILSHVRNSVARYNSSKPPSAKMFPSPGSIQEFLLSLGVLDSFESRAAFGKKFWSAPSRGRRPTNPFGTRWEEVARSMNEPTLSDRIPGDILNALVVDPKGISTMGTSHPIYQHAVKGKNLGITRLGETRGLFPGLFESATESFSKERMPVYLPTDAQIRNRVRTWLMYGHGEHIPGGVLEVDTASLIQFLEGNQSRISQLESIPPTKFRSKRSGAVNIAIAELASRRAIQLTFEHGMPMSQALNQTMRELRLTEKETRLASFYIYSLARSYDSGVDTLHPQMTRPSAHPDAAKRHDK